MAAGCPRPANAPLQRRFLHARTGAPFLSLPFPPTLSLPFPHTKNFLPRSGNFVAQRLIETADEPLRSELLGRVRLHAPLLRRLPYCKRLLARLERAETPPPPPPAHLLMRHQMPQ